MEKEFLIRAVELSKKSVEENCGPFGAIIVRNGEVISEAHNSVTEDNDPTAHAEINAIRKAAKSLSNFDLSDCEIYTSTEPCPMCLSAIYWSRIKKVYYANTRQDATEINFDDEYIYNELAKPINQRDLEMIKIEIPEAKEVFNLWMNKENKIEY